MPKGHPQKRETKRPKKKSEKQQLLGSPVFTSSEVEIVKKKRKPRDEDEE